MKISIFSFAVNDKFPIDIQHRQFRKHCPDDRFILFNDAVEEQMVNNLNITASYSNIECVRVPQSIHIRQNPSEGYAATLNWALHRYSVDNDLETIVMMHSDVFPLQHINIQEIIGDHVVASVTECREFKGETIHYLYPALTIINVKALGDVSQLNFECDLGLDTGGKTHTYVMKNRDKVKFIGNHQIPNAMKELTPGLQEYFAADLEICKAHGLNSGWIAEGFYHYMAGSQWNALDNTLRDGHKNRMDLFLKYFY